MVVDGVVLMIVVDTNGEALSEDEVSSHSSIVSATWESSHCNVKTKHVYGHQDNKYCGPLPLMESLNVRMDILAKEATTSLPVPPPVPSSRQPSRHPPRKGYGRVTVQGDMACDEGRWIISLSLVACCHYHLAIGISVCKSNR